MVRIVSMGGVARRAAAALPAIALATTGIAFATSSPDIAATSEIVVPEEAITSGGSPLYPNAGPAPAPMQLPPIYSTYVTDPSRVDQAIPTDPSQALAPVAPVRLDAHGIPGPVLTAYHNAANLLGRLDPGCGIDWALLGAIGRVESNHARFAGNTLDLAGIAQPGIIGIALDGSRGTATIRDTDGGQWDRDGVYDRAVGPMQFIPGTWRMSGQDGDGDGVANPQDMVDAATAAGVYLCSGAGNLRNPSDAYSAVMRYNHSDDYVRTVLSIAGAYRDGVTVLPMSALPAARPAAGTGSGTPDGSGFGWGGSSTPSSTPTGTPTPRPTATAKPSATSTGTTPGGTSGTPAPRPTSTSGSGSGSGSTSTPKPTSTSQPRLPLPPLPLPTTILPSLPLPSPSALSIEQLLALVHLPNLIGDPAGLVRVINPLTGALTCILDNKIVTCPGLLG